MENEKGEEGLSDEFKKHLEDEMLKSRANAMVDAMLEEDPSLDPKKAFEEAIRILRETPEETNNQISVTVTDNISENK